jgi:hypothetical protein
MGKVLVSPRTRFVSASAESSGKAPVDDVALP